MKNGKTYKRVITYDESITMTIINEEYKKGIDPREKFSAINMLKQVIHEIRSSRY